MDKLQVKIEEICKIMRKNESSKGTYWEQYLKPIF